MEGKEALKDEIEEYISAVEALLKALQDYRAARYEHITPPKVLRRMFQTILDLGLECAVLRGQC